MTSPITPLGEDIICTALPALCFCNILEFFFETPPSTAFLFLSCDSVHSAQTTPSMATPRFQCFSCPLSPSSSLVVECSSPTTKIHALTTVSHVCTSYLRRRRSGGRLLETQRPFRTALDYGHKISKPRSLIFLSVAGLAWCIGCGFFLRCCCGYFVLFCRNQQRLTEKSVPPERGHLSPMPMARLKRFFREMLQKTQQQPWRRFPEGFRKSRRLPGCKPLATKMGVRPWPWSCYCEFVSCIFNSPVWRQQGRVVFSILNNDGEVSVGCPCPFSVILPFYHRSRRELPPTLGTNQVDEYARLAREALSNCFDDGSAETAR